MPNNNFWETHLITLKNMYSKEIYITQSVWNNAFSYDQRIALGSESRLYIPSLIQENIAQLRQGSEICFEEVVDNKLVSCTGLKNFLQTTFHDTPVYIVDNHNHALSFRYTQRLNNSALKRLSVIHIDQHSDIKQNEHIFSADDDIETFVHTKTNVGNFITAAINSWIIKDVIQVRTDTALGNLKLWALSLKPFILDIDIDFRQDKEMVASDIAIVQDLMKKAELVTIATSPYFIDQEIAISLIKKLFI